MTRRTRLIVVGLAATLAAADWPRFRGPNGAGIAEGEVPLTFSTKGDNLIWKVEIPGRGNSSPIVVKDRIFVQSANKAGSERSLYCLDAANGAVKWTKGQTGRATKIHNKSSFASCTPASDGERVYACFWDGEAITLLAYDMEGKEAWTASLGTFASQHGAGLSPIVHGGKVFVNFDHDMGAEVVAFDAVSGAKAWTVPRKVFRASYSTPVIREGAGGKAELVVFSTAGATGYNPADGHVNWSWTIPWREGEMALRSVASPVLAGRLIVGVNGDGAGPRYATTLDPDAAGGPTPLWEKRSKELTPYVSCPVVRGEHIYWVTDQGVAECVEVKTGKVVWSERAFNKSISSSLVLVGDQVFGVDEGGKAVAWRADPKDFEIVSQSSVGEAVFASPAIADGKLYIRGAVHLFCIGKK